MGQIILVLIASGTGVTESTYTSAKTSIQSAITNFNTANANVNLALDTGRTQYVATGWVKTTGQRILEVLAPILAMQGGVAPVGGGGITPEMAALLAWLLSQPRKRRKRAKRPSKDKRLGLIFRAADMSLEAAELPEVLGILASPSLTTAFSWVTNMATTATVTKPAGIVAVHVPHGTTGDYHRFEPNQSSTGIQKPGSDDSAFTTTSVTFAVSGNNVTPTLPSAMRSIQLTLSNGHYYRLRNGVSYTVASGDASLFGTVSFTAA